MEIIVTSSNKASILKNISKKLLKLGLSACNQILPKIESHYIWEGNIQKDFETILIIKTSKSNLKEVKKIIMNMHNYKVPEIINVKSSILNKAYKKWFISIVE